MSLALAGVTSVVPLEEVIVAMNSIGRAMAPEFKDLSWRPCDHADRKKDR